MAAYINLCLQGVVYFAAHRSAGDDAMLRLYSSTLVGVARESTFDCLYSGVSQDWRQQDDIITPSDDRRWSHVGAVWTFDLDSDILRLDKEGHNFWVALDLVRQRSITISDFEPYQPQLRPTKHALPFVCPAPCWKMNRKGIDQNYLQRRKTFISRILADFAFQWRHVLCGRYNNFTFRRLAYAIVRIITLNFSVEEITLSRQGIGGFLIWIDDLPEWDFASGNIVRVGGTSIVMCQHAPHAITLVRNDFAKQIQSIPGSVGRSLTYLILSVHEVILCRINSELERYTEPKRLFDGTYPPSNEAIELLLQATQDNPTKLPLHKLPVELQDAILDKISAGPIESARISCLLDIGTGFEWRCGERNIEREVGRRCRTPWTPVESHILFGGYSSGVAYK